MTDQQRLVDILWANILHRLVGVGRRYFVLADHKLVLRGNPQLEVLAVTDHIKSRGAHDGHQPDHMQRIWRPRQDIAADFLVIGDVTLLHSPGRGVNVDRRLQRVDRVGLLINAVD